VLVALLPLPAVVWTVIALLRRLLRMSSSSASSLSRSRHQASESPVWAGVCWRMDGLVPTLSLFYVLPALVGLYGLAKCVIWICYR
jgi:hypothetical protein